MYSTVTSDDSYIYNSYDKNLDIHNLTTQTKVNSVSYGFYITDLWATGNYLFIGTLGSGIYNLKQDYVVTNSTIISGTQVFSEFPEITSNNIRSISGKDNFVSFCTDAGVDFFKLDPNGYRSQINVSGTYNSYVYSERECYYTVSGTAGWEVHKADPIVDWVPETFVSYGNSKAMQLLNDIYDLKVTKNVEDQTIIFLATDIGVVIINQDEDDYFCINTR